MRHAPARITVGLGASLLALGLAGCAGLAGSEERTSAVVPENSPAKRTGSPRPTPSPSPTASTQTPSAPSQPASPSGSARSKRTDRLLTAAQMPGLGDGVGWEATATRGSEGRDPFGTCHRFAMTSIGAMDVVVREFRSAQGGDSPSASQLVAEFPDETTARRGLEVLKSWRGQCAEQLADYERHDVGGLRALDAPGADAGWYLLTYGPVPGGGTDDAYVDAQGLTRVGSRIAVLQMRAVGQDYDHAPGQEPIAEAVRAASAALG